MWVPYHLCNLDNWPSAQVSPLQNAHFCMMLSRLAMPQAQHVHMAILQICYGLSTALLLRSSFHQRRRCN